jgi:hypothetical protein
VGEALVVDTAGRLQRSSSLSNIASSALVSPMPLSSRGPSMPPNRNTLAEGMDDTEQELMAQLGEGRVAPCSCLQVAGLQLRSRLQTSANDSAA